MFVLLQFYFFPLYFHYWFAFLIVKAWRELNHFFFYLFFFSKMPQVY